MKFWNIFLFSLVAHFAIADVNIPNSLYQVVGITDGDTLTAIDNEQKQYKVRLSDIDAPEKHQDFGEKSKQTLSNLVFNKNVKIDIKQIDKYGRFIGRIYVGNIDVSLEMVRLGMAHHYKKYSADQQIANAEEYAKANKLGLWSNPNPINPEQFRHSKKESKSEDSQQHLTNPSAPNPIIHKGKKCGDSYISQDKECHIDSISSADEPSKKTKHRKSTSKKEKSDSEKPKKRGNPYRDEKGRFTTKEKAVNNPKNKKSKKNKKEEE